MALHPLHRTAVCAWDGCLEFWNFDKSGPGGGPAVGELRRQIHEWCSVILAVNARAGISLLILLA